MIALSPAAPPSIEHVFADAARLAYVARMMATPAETLASRTTSPSQKLAAVSALHKSLTSGPQARRAQALESLRRAAADQGLHPEIRAAALSHLGYGVPLVTDAGVREAAVRTLLAALGAGPDRLAALRGLTAAAHELPPAVETDFQAQLLAVLPKTTSEAEKVAALLALDAFLRSDADLARRRPDLAAAIETSLLTPLAAAPATFVAAETPAVRALVVAAFWHAARRRHAAGDAAALTRADAAMKALLALETDPAVKAQLESYLAAPPPDPLKPTLV